MTLEDATLSKEEFEEKCKKEFKEKVKRISDELYVDLKKAIKLVEAKSAGEIQGAVNAFLISQIAGIVAERELNNEIDELTAD